MGRVPQGLEDLGISLKDVHIQVTSGGGAIEAGQSSVTTNIEIGHGRVASPGSDGTNSLGHTKETLEAQRKDVEEGFHMIASSMQESGLDGKTARDMQASSIDKANEPNTNSLDNFGGKMEETTSTYYTVN